MSDRKQWQIDYEPTRQAKLKAICRSGGECNRCGSQDNLKPQRDQQTVLCIYCQELAWSNGKAIWINFLGDPYLIQKIRGEPLI